MLGDNGRKVAECAAAMVFAADLHPSRRFARLSQMKSDAGDPIDVVTREMHALRLFTNEGPVSNAINCALNTALAPWRSMPTVVPTLAWSFKQSMIAASTFMYACESHGLDTFSPFSWCASGRDRYG